MTYKLQLQSSNTHNWTSPKFELSEILFFGARLKLPKILSNSETAFGVSLSFLESFFAFRNVKLPLLIWLTMSSLTPLTPGFFESLGVSCTPRACAISGTFDRDSFFTRTGAQGGVANIGGGGGGGGRGGATGGADKAFSAFSARSRASCSSDSTNLRRSSSISVCELFSCSSSLSC